MKPLTRKHFITSEEYLEFERAAPEKHEYFDGEIFDMAGTSIQHSTISTNIVASLHSQFKGRPCRVMQSDMRVHVPSTGLYTYPDIVVVCGKVRLSDDSYLDTLLNPDVIFEILSPSTADYDKGAKFEHYREIESLKQYVLVWQDKNRVARHTRQDDGSWLLNDFIGDDAEVTFSSIDCSLSMEDIYDKVDFSE